MSKAYDPFVDAENRGITVHRTELPGNLLGVANLAGRQVWLDWRLLQTEERSTLAHEIAHFDVDADNDGRIGGGPNGALVASVENECTRIASKWLIDFDELVNAAKWADSIEDVADELVVTDEMVRARMQTLTKDETKRFDREVGRGYAARLRGKPLQRKAPLKRR
ncbi:ImmA/IrrE family metallo-endopeptidase [Brevibacterium sp. R8603A2]|uniref:ImmA/IrrE family metallo-endopeptidase n=1 Tax=Brevibacterium sp. R8603A2 TaxID=2929779 RepID=UPI001FF8D95C|nr:ImmA/IrrE family metallo-endopeptidase [Brevibacterium sp. R8603A2]MCK1801476.1 ImmA/IrrE family metallo-endopeptidase [Brevibacterium sp. R8603A2]